MPKPKPQPLTPADPSRCQADVRPGSFMTLGPRQWERCSAAPTVIISEIKPGPDGQRGSMSLCASCLDVYKQKVPAWKTTVTIAQLKPA